MEKIVLLPENEVHLFEIFEPYVDTETLQRILDSTEEIPPMAHQTIAATWSEAEMCFFAVEPNTLEERSAFRKMIELAATDEEFRETRVGYNYLQENTPDQNYRELVLLVRKTAEFLNQMQ